MVLFTILFLCVNEKLRIQVIPGINYCISQTCNTGHTVYQQHCIYQTCYNRGLLFSVCTYNTMSGVIVMEQTCSSCGNVFRK